MPEGPEVKTTVDWLTNFKGKTLKSIGILSGRYAKKNGIPGWDSLNFPAILKDVECKGKFIYFTFDSEGKDVYMFNTLGMSGMWSNIRGKHARVVLFFSDAEPLFYNDIRNFGTLKVVNSQSDLNKKLKSLGPDMLEDGIGPEQFYKRIHKYGHKTIAEVIMNQKVVSGIGNYLKAECLYAAKISPHRFCCHISEKELQDLFYACRKIIRLSYETGGATISTYRQSNGKKGLYSRRFAVYNQKQDPFGNEVIRETTRDKRTTHWVPTVQK